MKVVFAAVADNGATALAGNLVDLHVRSWTASEFPARSWAEYQMLLSPSPARTTGAVNVCQWSPPSREYWIESTPDPALIDRRQSHGDVGGEPAVQSGGSREDRRRGRRLGVNRGDGTTTAFDHSL